MSTYRTIAAASAIASFIGAGWIGNAQAADIPVPSSPSITVVGWTGCYVGGHGGYIWGNSKQTYGGTRAGNPDAFLAVGADLSRYQVDGPVFGSQVGCNLQAGHWVWGVEADGAWTEARGSGHPVLAAIAAGSNAARVFRTSQHWLATARGRVGYAADKWLWYVTGGVAFTELRVNNDACIVAANACRTRTSVERTGWIAGVGAEYSISSNWSVKNEVLYTDFGTFHYTDSPAANGCVQCYSANVRLKEVIWRVGVNYRFGGSAIVARY